jgi:hypothetical protein
LGTWFPYIFIIGAINSGVSAYLYIKVSNPKSSAGGIAMILMKADGKTIKVQSQKRQIFPPANK